MSLPAVSRVFFVDAQSPLIAQGQLENHWVELTYGQYFFRMSEYTNVPDGIVNGVDEHTID